MISFDDRVQQLSMLGRDDLGPFRSDAGRWIPHPWWRPG
jgi:hypothetical protein